MSLTSRKARAMSALRKHHRGGRPPVPTPCPACGEQCPSRRESQAHCRVYSAYDAVVDFLRRHPRGRTMRQIEAAGLATRRQLSVILCRAIQRGDARERSGVYYPQGKNERRHDSICL